MALNKDTLGIDLYNASINFNDANIDIDDPVAVEAYRKNFWTAIAEKIINHIKNTGVVNVTVATTGTATAHTGTGTGTIS